MPVFHSITSPLRISAGANWAADLPFRKPPMQQFNTCTPLVVLVIGQEIASTAMGKQKHFSELQQGHVCEKSSEL